MTPAAVRRPPSMGAEEASLMPLPEVEALAKSVQDGDGEKIPILVRLLQKYKTKAALSKDLCAALETLSFANKENHQLIAEQSGVETLLTMVGKKDVGAELLLIAL